MNDTIKWDSAVAGEVTDLLLRSIRNTEECATRINSVHSRLYYEGIDSGDQTGNATLLEIMEKLTKLRHRLEQMEQETTSLRRGVFRCAEMFDDTERELVTLTPDDVGPTDVPKAMPFPGHPAPVFSGHHAPAVPFFGGHHAPVAPAHVLKPVNPVFREAAGAAAAAAATEAVCLDMPTEQHIHSHVMDAEEKCNEIGEVEVTNPMDSLVVNTSAKCNDTEAETDFEVITATTAAAGAATATEHECDPLTEEGETLIKGGSREEREISKTATEAKCTDTEAETDFEVITDADKVYNVSMGSASGAETVLPDGVNQ